MAVAAPIIGGIGSIAAGIGATSMVVKGLMFAGGAMTLVGGLTGNRRLTQLGGIASLAGGVGGLAAGAFSGGSSAAGAANTSSTGLSAAANSSGGITDMIAQGSGGLSSMGGAQGLQASGLGGAAGGSSGLIGNAMGAGSGLQVAGSGFGNAAGTAGSLVSRLSGAAKGVGGFIRNNPELTKIGGEMLSGAMEGRAARELADLERKHQMAMKEKDYALARQLEEELYRRRNDSITGLRPMDEVLSVNQEGGPITQGYHNAVSQPGGIISREWQPRGA